MRRFVLTLALLTAVAATPATAMAGGAPEPAKAVDLDRYLGRWYEIARLHNKIEENCARSTADYLRDAQGNFTAVETCHHGAPDGPASVWRPRVRVLDPGRNAKLRLTFFPLVYRDYWVLDHADDYDWAIVATSNGRFLWLFARRPAISETAKSLMVARARALGYDTGKLIYDQ